MTTFQSPSSGDVVGFLPRDFPENPPAISKERSLPPIP